MYVWMWMNRRILWMSMNDYECLWMCVLMCLLNSYLYVCVRECVKLVHVDIYLFLGHCAWVILLWLWFKSVIEYAALCTPCECLHSVNVYTVHLCVNVYTLCVWVYFRVLCCVLKCICIWCVCVCVWCGCACRWAS